MSKKKVCKKCRLFVDGEECPVCHTQQFTTNFQGRLGILDAEKSEIAKKVGAKQAGEYAIKVR